MVNRCDPEKAREFTKELDALMKKYCFAFPCLIEVFPMLPGDWTLKADTELLEKIPDNPKYDYFLIHYEGEKE